MTPESTLLFLVGEHGSGKTEAARILEKKLGFAWFDCGPTLRAIHKDTRPDLSFGEYMALMETTYGPSFSDQLLLDHISGIQSPNLAIIGNRSLGGIDFLKRGLNGRFTRQDIIWLECQDTALLRKRCNLRDNTDRDEREFIAWLERDINMGLPAIRPVANHVIVNDCNTTTGILEQRLLEVLRT